MHFSAPMAVHREPWQETFDLEVARIETLLNHFLDTGTALPGAGGPLADDR